VTGSGTPSETQTASVTQTPSSTGTGTPSLTQSGTPSSTQTQSQTPTLTQTPTTTPVGPALYDGTLSISAPLLSDSPAVVLGATGAYAVAFTVLEGDSACGPGTWSLTQLVIALGPAPGGAARANFVINVYAADPGSGIPGASVAARALVGVPVPAAPSYLTLQLSALRVDTSSAKGSSYALVLTTDTPVALYSVNSGTYNDA